MCGIFALLSSSLDYVEPSVIEDFFNKGKKRGPESSSFTFIPSCSLYLGFHRLAINGLNPESDQPIIQDKKQVICNGEIYNHKQLFNSHQVTPKTQSDCEVILPLYEHCGKNCVSMLDGVFAFILYDAVKNQIMVARDPYGIRPLYMCYYKNESIGFASDIEPLLFNSQIYNISSFPPGTYAIFTPEYNVWKMTHHERYFFSTSYIECISEKKKPIEYYMYHFVLKLNEAVEKRVENCEREIACLLSGGLDSSIISALVTRIYKKKTGKILETYSIGLKDGEDLDYANKMASHIGSTHHEVIMTPEGFMDSIPHVIRDIESYDTTTVRASVGNWNIGKYISKTSKARVIFNGDGSDELTGGYLYFNACPNDEEFHNETLHLLSYIHRFDVLRSDKSISSHGLEPRTPFLDKELTRFYLNIPIEYRNHNRWNGEKKCEKCFLRNAINQFEPNLLPDDILWRKKEAFSDGVSSTNNSWFHIIQKNMSNYESEKTKSRTINVPQTNEQMYYRDIFESIFGEKCAYLIPYFWMPKYVKEVNDASARCLHFYDTKS